jgi:hypothetical protein
MKMYVWSPASIADYSGGVVCVVAGSKHEAINLAVSERYPLAGYRRDMSDQKRLAVWRANAETICDRIAFLEELRRERPRVIRRGVVIEFGGG